MNAGAALKVSTRTKRSPPSSEVNATRTSCAEVSRSSRTGFREARSTPWERPPPASCPPPLGERPPRVLGPRPPQPAVIVEGDEVERRAAEQLALRGHERRHAASVE